MARAVSSSFIVLFTCLLLMASARAGIVEMPNVEEPPSMEGGSIYENHNIPSVSGRFFDPCDGPRLWVKEMRLQGIVEVTNNTLYKDETITGGFDSRGTPHGSATDRPEGYFFAGLGGAEVAPFDGHLLTRCHAGG